MSALRCPECKELVATKDGKHYGVHFAKVTDQKPCVLSTKPIKEKPMGSDNTLRVESILDKLKPWLTERAVNVFKEPRAGLTPELRYFGRLIEGEITDDTYRDFAERLNAVVATFDGSLRRYLKPNNETVVCKPKIVDALAVPMMIPLASLENQPKRCAFVVYLFVVDLPFWEWEDGKCIYNVELGNAFVNDLVGHHMLAHREGELPRNAMYSIPEHEVDLHHSMGVEVAAIIRDNVSEKKA